MLEDLRSVRARVSPLHLTWLSFFQSSSSSSEQRSSLTWLLVIFFAITSAALNLHAVSAGPHLYGTGTSSNTVTGLAFDPITGSLTSTPGSPIASGQPSGIAVDPTSRFLYVTNVNENTISVFNIAAGSGALSSISGSPFGSGGLHPVAVTIDAAGKFLYVANQNSATITVFKIDAETGAISQLPIGPFVTGTGPQFNLALYPNGNFLYFVNFDPSVGTGWVSKYTVDPATGGLSGLTTAALPAGSAPDWVSVEPIGRFLYVGATSSGSKQLHAFSINQASGDLTTIVGSPYTTGPSSVTSVPFAPRASAAFYSLQLRGVSTGPAGEVVEAYVYDNTFDGSAFGHLVITDVTANTVLVNRTYGDYGGFNASGTFAEQFLLPASHTISISMNGQEFSGMAILFGGTVVAEAGYASTLPNPGYPSFSTTIQSSYSVPEPIAIDSQGHFLYVGNATNGTTSAYSINQASGALASVPGSPFSGGGAGTIVEPSGHFLYATGYSSSALDSISGFQIDQNSGALTSIGAFALSPGTSPLTLTSALPQTTTTVVSNPSTSLPGTQVPLVATVQSDGSPVTTGTVSFMDGASVIGGPFVPDANGKAFLTATFPLGIHTITAKYSGTGLLAQSSGTTTQTVMLADTTSAGTAAFTAPVNGITVGHDPGNPVNIGNVFTANTDIWVTSLGFYAENGAAPFVNDETVTIYDANGTTLTSAVVSRSGAIVNGYHWQTIPPLQLHAGQSYTVSAYVGANSWGYGGLPATVPEITYTAHRYTYGGTPAYPTNTVAASGEAYYGPNFTFSANPYGPGNIVVSNDEWMFDDSYLSTNDDLQFAKNVVNFLAGSSGDILILADAPYIRGSQLQALLLSLGYSVNVTNTIPESFAGYKAVLMTGALQNSANLTAMLTNFVNNGGGVFIEGGSGWQFTSGSQEAAFWNPFLSNFGLSLSTNYNSLQGNIDVSSFQSQSAIGATLFGGVNTIYMNGGNDVLFSSPDHPDPNSQIFSNLGHGMFGVYSYRGGSSSNTIIPASPITLPAELQSTFTGGNNANLVDTFVTPYTASQDGWITSWRTEFLGQAVPAGPLVPAGVQLKVFRNTPNGMQLVAEGPVHDPRPILQQLFPNYPNFSTTASLTTFSDSPIPVKQGDFVGLTIYANPAVGVYAYPMVGPAGTVQVPRNVSVGQTVVLTDPQTQSVANPPALSFKLAPSATANPLTLLNNYFVTGDYVARGVQIRGSGINGQATANITIPSANESSDGIPEGADIVAAYLYWASLENSPSASSSNATFRGYQISGQQIGKNLQYNDLGERNGTLRVYRADVLPYFDVSTGVRRAAGSHTVILPDSGSSALPNTEGASLVVVWRVMSPAFPLKSVVLYDGASVSDFSAVPVFQNLRGFYDSKGAAKLTSIYNDGATWKTSTDPVSLANHAAEYSTILNGGALQAWTGVVLSTPVNNSDNDGILDAWKSGPSETDFHAGQAGYYDAKYNAWIPLPGAAHGHRDLFVQLDYMCTNIVNGTCDPAGRSELPVPDAQGHDPIAMLTQTFANHGISLHVMIGNAIQEETCTDNLSANPPQLCKYPGEPGVVDWKIGVDISKIWPRNPASCASGGDCSPRFPYGAKDSYHYVLMANSLGVAAWNTRWGTLTSITVSNKQATIVTTDRGNGVSACPNRITISGALGNAALNGVYAVQSCANSRTLTIATPNVSDWTYPNSTLPEPVLGITSGTVTSISGFSDLGGADSVISLGKWETSPNQDMSKRVNVQVGTILHEIAHTLGLSHGGTYFDAPGSYKPTFEANCKPNYQSVMNYMFQIDLLGPNHVLDLSNQNLDLLNESSLGSVTRLGMNCSGGSCGFVSAYPTSRWYVPFNAGNPATPAVRHCDGTALNPGESMYRVDADTQSISWMNGQDINFDGQLNTSMRGYNDWDNLDLRQVGATGGEFASLASLVSFGNISAPLNIDAGGNVTLGSGGTVTLGSGGNVTLGSGGTVTLGSAGTITLGSGGNVTLGSGGTVTLGSGGTVALGSGGNITLGSGGTITLGSGGNITLGSGGTVTLGAGGTITLGSGGTYVGSPGDVITLGAGGNVTLGSAGTIALGSAGTITLGSGGTITLGSGGNITLGSGGTVTLGSGGLITMGSGGTVTLGSGGNVTLGSGGTVTLGSGGTVALGSGGNVTLGSGGTVTLGAGGNVTLGSGGNVTLGSGGTIALGSGGNITLGSGGVVTLGSGGTVALGSGGNITLGAGGSYVGSAGDVISLGLGGNITLGSGGNVTLGSGGVITMGSGGTVTLGSGGNVTLGSGGVVTLGSGGTVALGSGGTVTLGSGGNVTLGSAGNITLGSAGNVTLGSAGNITLGSGGGTLDEMTFESANSIVRPPETATKTPITLPGGPAVRIDWTPPIFGVVSGYTIYRSINGGTPVVIGTVSGDPPVTTFNDINPPTSGTVVYTISTGVTDGGTTTRESLPSPPAVLKFDQTITFAPLPNKRENDPPFVVSATVSPSNMLISFAATGNCSVSDSTQNGNVSSSNVTLNGVGTCSITASQVGSDQYNPATSVTRVFSVAGTTALKQDQTIAFGTLTAKTFGDNDFAVSASATSNLPVSFSGSGAACSVSSAGNVHVIAAGTCSITASQSGNNLYNPAPSVAQNLAVNRATATISIGNIPSNAVFNGSLVPTYTYVGDGTSKYTTSSTTAVCTVAGSTVNFVGVGTCKLTAHASAGPNYLAATGIEQSFTINQTLAPISINNIPSPAFYGNSFAPTYAYAGDGVKSATSSTTSICSIAGTTVNFVGIGTCTLTAHAAAGINFAAADGNPQSFTVIATPLISEEFSPSTTTVNGVVTLTFTLTNRNAFALSAVAFADSLPSGVQLAASPAATNTCGGILSAPSGSTSISLTNGTIAANKTCAVSVKVQAVTTGTKVNTTSAISSGQAGTGNPATASLIVNKSSTLTISGIQQAATGSTVKLTMSLTVSSVASGPVKPGGIVKVIDLLTNTTLANVTIDINGKGSFTLEKRKPVDLKIQSTYQGDNNFLSSTTGTLEIHVH